jgi:putative redox protein
MNESKAIVQYAGDDLYVAISPSGHALSLETNGDRNCAATPIELLLMALGACTGSDVVNIMSKKRETLTRYRVEIRGRRRDTEPRSFEQIEVKHFVEGRNISEEALRQAIELSDKKYCSVAATLRPTANIVSSYEILEEDSGRALANLQA